jgi:hypothetical protein
MPRINDFGQPEYGKEESWSAMREAIYDGEGRDIERDETLQGLFDLLLPDHDDYPSGSRDEVEFYVDDITDRINFYLWSEYGDDYNIEEFFDWGDWRENYDAA